MHFRKSKNLCVALSVLALSGCAATPDLTKYSANTYSANQLNQVQEVKTVELLSVLGARVAIDNSANAEKNAKAGAVFGALLGAALAVAGGDNNPNARAAAGGAIGAGIGSAAGASTPTVLYEEGVTLTYIYDGRALSSTQVGKACEFKPGPAVMVNTGKENETRIQPNAVCEVKK